MAGEHILVVEDEDDILELVQYNLRKEGYRVTGVTSGEQGLEAAASKRPDLIVLDLMLPGIDGLEVCRLTKNNPSTERVSIIMLTAKGEEADIVSGLELGADDYLTKPFSPRVLLARVRAVLRRREIPPDAGATVRVHDLLIHPGRHEVAVGGKPIDLTFSEFQILYALARKPGWVFTRNQLVDAIRGEDYAVTSRSVDVHITSLRKKLGGARKYVETVRGVGYRLKE
ncbi:MAG: DNA-binding response regulator [Candidatus Abyssobacteria bacterium SURF_5]|uniref:DNA-binding response regulator n=1 Tax=Abyssobacteria bacterium (strain SURF_5) TaxID=2093360 RepID=A0A3A4NGZ1_ABYX5|nr:MAG: DNA-binding response regulator [Candidatus Abyssubacteria bacterium SURF_5]